MKADADLIAGRMLVELKTGLGDRRADGSRRAGLDGPTLQQRLGYELLDSADEFMIQDVGLYSARYDHLAIWGVPNFCTNWQVDQWICWPNARRSARCYWASCCPDICRGSVDTDGTAARLAGPPSIASDVRVEVTTTLFEPASRVATSRTAADFTPPKAVPPLILA